MLHACGDKMASSSDAVRNLVYDVHLYDLAQARAAQASKLPALKSEAFGASSLSCCPQGWAIVQQLVAKDLDSWEKIHAAYPVNNLQEHVPWDDADAGKVASFLRECPLLGQPHRSDLFGPNDLFNHRPPYQLYLYIGDKLASRLAAQAAHFMQSDQSSPLKRSQSTRKGGLKERMAKMHMGRKQACKPNKSVGSTAAMFSVFKKLQLVPFAQAVDHPGFTA